VNGGAVVLALLAMPAVWVAAVDDTGPDGGGHPPIEVELFVDVLLGLVPQDEIDDFWREFNDREHLQVQACMHDAGFEYEPPNLDDRSFAHPIDAGLEYAEQWGFGMLTVLDPDADQPPSGGDRVDPNIDILDALDPAAQDAWYAVQERCAEQEIDEGSLLHSGVFTQLMDDFQTLVETDQRMRDAQAAWSDCMIEAGHPYESEQQLIEWVYGELRAESSGFYDSQAWEPDSPDHEDWLEMVELEIEVAVANARCSADLDEVRREVNADLRGELTDMILIADWDAPPDSPPE
jgi:hypothetical protein